MSKSAWTKARLQAKVQGDSNELLSWPLSVGQGVSFLANHRGTGVRGTLRCKVKRDKPMHPVWLPIAPCNAGKATASSFTVSPYLHSAQS